jgi:hypothetical protein
MIPAIFKYRLKEKYRRKVKAGLIIVAILLTIVFLYSPVSSSIDKMLYPKSYGKIKVDWYRDYNALHLHYAKHLGIEPFKSDKAFRASIDELLKQKKLKKIKSNRYYTVQYLTHSHPYLTPLTIELLEDIGKRFNQKLVNEGMGRYSYQISSVLRTKESQRRLRGVNRNATPNTTSHLYGTTIDIPYETVIKRPLPWVRVEVADAKAIKLLSKAIGELRMEGRCVVVTEKFEKCFHITVKNE